MNEIVGRAYKAVISRWLSIKWDTQPIVLSGNRLSFLFALFLTILFNAKIWLIYLQNNTVVSVMDGLQFLSFFLFVYFLLLSLIFISNFPWLQKIVLGSVILVSAPAMYFSLALGVFFDVSMLQNVLETDAREAFELLTPAFWTVFLLAGILPLIFLIKLKVSYGSLLKQTVTNLFCSTLFLALAFISVYPFYGELSFFIRNNNSKLASSLLPVAPFKATFENFRLISKESHIVKQVLDKDARIVAPATSSSNKPLAVVVIIGETAREKSFSLRDEGMVGVPETLLNEDNLVYLPNFWSCGTNTAMSVPCMFSLFAKDDYQREMNKKYENVAELIDRVGIDVLWRNNNSGCKGICGRLRNEPVDIQSAPQFKHDSEFYDEALVFDLAQRVSKTPVEQLIFLHQLGSHGPAYYKRVPNAEKILQPACESQDFTQCSQMEIRNAYNNTVLYTKKLIGEAIEQMKSISGEYDTVLIYLSDHGESTGEKGIYLHGIPYFMAPEEQTHIPALIWMSPGFIDRRGIDFACLKNTSSNRYSHDNFAHTLLGLFDIDTRVYSNTLDLLNNCKTKQSIAPSNQVAG